VSIWIFTGLGIGGLLLAARAWLKQPGGDVRQHPILTSTSTKPSGDLRECVWCDRIINRPSRACSTICDHELKHLALSHPDALCRAELQEMKYQWFGEDQWYGHADHDNAKD